MNHHPRVVALLAFALFSAPLAGTTLADEPAPPVLQIANPTTGQMGKYQVSLDELYYPASGLKKIPAQASLDSLSLFMVDMMTTTTETAYLVLYPQGSAHNEANRQILTDKIVVTSNAAGASSIGSMNGVYSVRPVGDFAPDCYEVTVTNPSKVLDTDRDIRAVPGVRATQPQVARQLQPRAAPTDTLYPQQWHLKNTAGGIDLNVSPVWDTYKGDGVIVAIVDDGLDIGHEDLAPSMVNTLNFDFNGNDNNPTEAPGQFHGTACAGCAAARGFNGYGVVGVAPRASLVGLRLIGGPTTDSTEANAMNWKKDTISIKSNSWGPTDGGTLGVVGPLTLSAIQSAATTGRGSKGTIFLWAAGNGGATDNSNLDGYANSMYAIAVGAVGEDGKLLDYSEPGANIAVCAPSGPGPNDPNTLRGIVTTDVSGTTGYSTTNYASDFNGTSAACPQVAGVTALMLKANSSLTWREVQNILIRTAVKNDATNPEWITNGGGLHFHHNYGAGLVNAQAAVAAAVSAPHLAQMLTFTKNAAGPFPLPIPDTATPVTFTIPIATSIHSLEHVVLAFSATHSYRGDLEIKIKSPAGTESILTQVHGDSGNDYTAWPFMTVRNWGEDPNGIWTVTVTDEAAIDVGSVTAATLKLYGTAGSSTPIPPGVGSAVVVTSHTEGARVSAGSATFRGTASLSAGIRSIEYRITNFGAISSNSKPILSWTKANGTSPWNFTTSLKSGYNTIEIRAVATTGAVSDSTVFHLLVK